MKSKEQQTVCDICGKPGARLRRMTKTYGRGKQMLLIENVPVIFCPNCGESYLTAETLHEIDRIKEQRKRLAVERSVEVASFA